MYKEVLVLNNFQGLIFHKTQPNLTKPNQDTSFLGCYLFAGVRIRYIPKLTDYISL